MDNNFLDDDDNEEIIDDEDEEFEEEYVMGDSFAPLSSSDDSNALIEPTSSSLLDTRQTTSESNFIDSDQLQILNEFNLENYTKQLLDKAGTGDVVGILYKHWRNYVPLCFSCSDNPVKNLIETDTTRILLKPLEVYICNSMDTEKVLAKLHELDDPPQLCGRVFKAGEPSYFCRDCGIDPTCVLCSNCFCKSKHREHRYKMMTSGGGGYCDCGDPEAWRSHPNCELHMPKSEQTNENDSIESYVNKLPKDLVQRTEELFTYLLDYIFDMISIEKNEELPENLKPEKESDDYLTILYNDEVHSYEQVVSTLRKVLNIDDKKAFDYASVVDKEGRSAIKRGKKSECAKVKENVEKTMGGSQNIPLETKVLHHSLVTHQYFAEKLMVWLQKICECSKGLKHILCKIGMFVKSDGQSIIEKLMTSDNVFWKSARSIVHQFFISIYFMDPNWKKNLPLYTPKNYVKNPDDVVSLTDLTVQMFTVISLSKYLITNYNILQVIMETLIEHSKTSKGKLSFPRNRKGNPEFRRAQFMLNDFKYCLTAVPEEWNDDLRKNFINGFKSFVEFIKFMHGMDSIKRETQQHIEYEPEWETSFNLLIKLQKSISSLIDWCSSDKVVYLECYKYLLNAIHQVETNDPLFKYGYEKRKFNGQTYEIIDYPVLKQEVSIHATLTRLFPAIYAKMEKYSLNFQTIQSQLQSSSSNPLSSLKHDLPKQKMIALLEPSTRALVLVSQTNCGLWKRNGFSLLSQVYFYGNIKCRHEMLDKDILCLQMGASTMESNEFLINQLTHFNLFEFFTSEFDVDDLPSELRQTEYLLPISEDFLGLLIYIISERFETEISQIERLQNLEREIIHQLCISPMAHSDLVKNVYSDNEKYTNELETVLHKIAIFKPSSGTTNAKGIYELKEEYQNYYSPFFYHYTRSDKTKSEEFQLSLKKLDKEKFFKPHRLPPLKKLFSNISHLLDSDVFVQIVFRTLRRFINKSKYSSEGQLARILHLIGLALYEEQDDVDRNFQTEEKIYSFKFLEKSILNNKKSTGLFSIKSLKTEENLIKYLNDIVTSSTSDQYKLLAAWLADYAQRLVKLKHKIDQQQKQTFDSSIEMTTAKTSTSASCIDLTESKTTSDLNDEMQKEKRKNQIAERRRAKVLAQLNQMQKKFISNNKEFYEETKSTSISLDASEASAISSLIPSYDSHMEVCPAEIICIGPNQTVSSLSDIKKKHHVCILCQENQEISINAPPMVLCCYVISSKVLSKNRVQSIEDFDSFDPIFMKNNLFWGINTTSCGHVMHATCWQKYVDTVRLAENRRHNRFYGGFNIKRNEYLCPLCETIGNTVLPLFPDFKELNLVNSGYVESKNEYVESKTSVEAADKNLNERKPNPLLYEDWLDGLQKTLENSVKKELQDDKDVFIINPCPLSTITKLMAEAVANNFKSLFEFDSFTISQGIGIGVGGSGGGGSDEVKPSTSTTTSSLSASLSTSSSSSSSSKSSSSNRNNQDEIKLNNETINIMETFTRASYTFGFCQYPHDDDSRMLIGIWSNCAYTIQIIEQLLRIESKSLFGQFTFKQAELISNLVKQSALYGIAKYTLVRQTCLRLLAAILPHKTVLFDTRNIFEYDLFHLLVYLSLSMPNLYENPKITSVANGGLNDFNIFKLVLQAHCVQILITKLRLNTFKSNDENASANTNANTNTTNNFSDDELKVFEFYKFLVDLVQEKNLIDLKSSSSSSSSSLLSSSLSNEESIRNRNPRIVYETLKDALAPFLRCSALFFANLTDLAPNDTISSNPDDLDENFSKLLRFMGLSSNLSDLLDIQSNTLKRLCQTWISNASSVNTFQSNLVDYPLKVNEFIDLPNDFVDLMSMSLSNHTCSSRASSLIEASESATILCLICGEMLCSQTFCCQQEIGKKRVGSCTAHAYKCGNTFGVFLRVAECQILLLHLNIINPDDLQVRGCFLPAPYLDDYGETDQGLRRGNPLHFCKTRYKKLYRDWLSHAIPDEVSRSYQSQNNSLVQMDWIQF